MPLIEQLQFGRQARTRHPPAGGVQGQPLKPGVLDSRVRDAFAGMTEQGERALGSATTGELVGPFESWADLVAGPIGHRKNATRGFAPCPLSRGKETKIQGVTVLATRKPILTKRLSGE
jgi:hypothetical protein